MPRNVYHEINLHIVWRTKADSPVLVDSIEHRCQQFIIHRATESPGVFVHEIGGMPDHVHLAVSVPPTLLISEWIGQLKGASSHYVNHEIVNRRVLDWQAGYGVVSFGTKDVPWVVEYIRYEKDHHHAGRVFDRLEQIVEVEKAPQGHIEKPAEADS